MNLELIQVQSKIRELKIQENLIKTQILLKELTIAIKLWGKKD